MPLPMNEPSPNRSGRRPRRCAYTGRSQARSRRAARSANAVFRTGSRRAVAGSVPPAIRPGFVVARMIERVRHRPDELSPDSRGNCVSVERNDVPMSDNGDVPDEREAVAAPAAQQRVEIQLAPLALVPIQTFSAAFQRRGRWSRKNRSAARDEYFAFSCSIPLRARRRSGSSSLSDSCAASEKSVSRPKCRWSSRLPRNRTSSDSSSSSIRSSEVKSVGITTRLRNEAGSPSEKSILGSGCGVVSRADSQFASADASWLAPSTVMNPRSAYRQPSTPASTASTRGTDAKSAVIDAMAPR